jgi:hypothetical protein
MRCRNCAEESLSTWDGECSRCHIKTMMKEEGFIFPSIDDDDLWDEVAKAAMQGDVSRVGYYQQGEHMERAAKNAFDMADAFMAERARRREVI